MRSNHSNILDFRRALLTILSSKNITLRHYTPQSETLTTPTNPVAEAVQNLQDMQMQAHMFLKRMQDQEALLANLAATPTTPLPPPPCTPTFCPAPPSLLTWNGNPYRTHLQNELADAHRQLEMLNTVVYDYETLREKHDDMLRKAAAQITEHKNNFASAQRIIDQMRLDSKQDRAEVEHLESQIRKLKAMQRKFVTDLQAARLGCEQEVGRRLVIERGLDKAHCRHFALILRVAFDAWRFRLDAPGLEHRRRVAEFRATSGARSEHFALIFRVAFDAWRFRLDAPGLEHRRRVAEFRATSGARSQHLALILRVALDAWRLRLDAPSLEHRRRGTMLCATTGARSQHLALILRVALDAWRFRLDAPNHEHRRRIAIDRAANIAASQHLGLLARIAWRAWTDLTQGAWYGRFQAHKTWGTFTMHATLRTALGLSRSLTAWHRIS